MMNILVAGVARSGTSWLGDVVAKLRRSRLLFEPFVMGRNRRLMACYPKHQAPTWADRLPNYSLYLDASLQSVHGHDLTEILSGDCPHGEFERGAGKSSKIFFPARRSITIKAIRANFMFRFLNRYFEDMPKVFIVRDPVSVVNSMLGMNKRDWQFDLDTVCLREQPELWDRLSRWHAVIDSATSETERLAVRWCVENRIALDDLSGARNALVLDYHDFSLKQSGFKELLKLIGSRSSVDGSSDLKVLKAVSHTSRRQDSTVHSGHEELANLDAESVKTIRNYAQQFGLANYLKDDRFWRQRGVRFLEPL